MPTTLAPVRAVCETCHWSATIPVRGDIAGDAERFTFEDAKAQHAQEAVACATEQVMIDITDIYKHFYPEDVARVTHLKETVGKMAAAFQDEHPTCAYRSCGVAIDLSHPGWTFDSYLGWHCADHVGAGGHGPGLDKANR